MAATQIMRCAFLSRVIWLILGAISLNAAVPLQAAPVAFAPSLPVSSAVMESYVAGDEVFFQETSSVSREFGLQCARQSKQVLALAHSFGPYSRDREQALRLHTTVVTQVSSPVPVFFPRKVAPSSSDNDPFLS
jgi:hypothetical protein